MCSAAGTERVCWMPRALDRAGGPALCVCCNGVEPSREKRSEFTIPHSEMGKPFYLCQCGATAKSTMSREFSTAAGVELSSGSTAGPLTHYLRFTSAHQRPDVGVGSGLICRPPTGPGDLN